MPDVIFPNDNEIKYKYVSWQKLGDLTDKLAQEIISKNETSSINRIIALATGGLTTSRALRDYLAVSKISSIQIEFYTDIGKNKKTPVVTQSLPTNIDGETILIFDDINDSGKTLKTATQYLTLRGAKKIITATIFQKPHTTFPSDYYQEETKAWIIFPDEIRETITLLNKRWSNAGLKKREIQNRLSKIGFTQAHIDAYLT